MVVQPSKPNRTQARGDASRRRILEEATRLFGLYGYSSVSVREIGAAAGLDNSTLYRYFESKQALAKAVVQDILKDLAPVIAHFDPTHEPSLEQLVNAVVAFSRHLWKKTTTARLLLAWMSTTGEERSGFSYSIKLSENTDHPAAQMVRRVVDWIALAQSNGSIRPVAPIDAIVNLLALAIVRPATAGYFLHSLDAHQSTEERQRTAESELRAAIRGAFAPIEDRPI